MRETLDGFASLRGVATSAVDRLLVELGLEERGEQLVETLSGGWRQKVALAVALVGDPSLLLLDEPSASLDDATRLTLLETLQRLKAAGKTIVFVSHSAEAVKKICDRACVLDHGSLVFLGKPQEAIEHYHQLLGQQSLPAT